MQLILTYSLRDLVLVIVGEPFKDQGYEQCISRCAFLPYVTSPDYHSVLV